MAKFKPHQWTAVGGFVVRTTDQRKAAHIVVNELDGLVPSERNRGHTGEGYEWMRLSEFRAEMVRNARPRQ